ncbi:cytochrome d ubiquinol oxidase subunit II [Entomobacter blattae]|uniref:Cytochrome bd-I ubiquinol oxidase subunit 2 n=1 Tax=Entomobacter blattae TaxID=2762277 RepID=A0A7H1NQB5_9PROT|nr:cytochrome d ubiquinol oxidase subunit II [Entomobacter blattae]QNT77975.1 Cytochrome bd-I ubiquinol oxidase subunit 2 [Entomobacter blattae]
MSGAEYWIPIIWSGIAAIAILTYILLDGFDLGIGILFAVEKNPTHRNIMLNTIAPIWDGNETWMVLGGATLFGVFPMAYSIILSAFYPVIITMLLALIFRGVAFEFRFKVHSPQAREYWGFAFMAGSCLTAFCQGIVLGALIQGITIDGQHFAGSHYEWLTPFSLLCGFSVIVGYALLGSTWLIMKTEGALAEYNRKLSWLLTALLVICIGIVSLWTPFLNETYMRNWFSWPHILFVLPVPLCVVLAAFGVYFGIYHKLHAMPFFCSLFLFFLCFSGLGISIWPYIVPPSITIWEASSSPYSQGFLLFGTAILLPLILIYTLYSYWVFRGKVTEHDFYH